MSGIRRAGATDRLNLGIADDQTKMQLLSQIPGLDLGFANQRTDISKFNSSATLDADKFNTAQKNDLNKFNVGNTLEAMSKDNANKMGIYGEQMKGWAAGQQAVATAKSGKK